jgi:hypothetical protein
VAISSVRTYDAGIIDVYTGVPWTWRRLTTV